MHTIWRIGAGLLVVPWCYGASQVAQTVLAELPKKVSELIKHGTAQAGTALSTQDEKKAGAVFCLLQDVKSRRGLERLPADEEQEYRKILGTYYDLREQFEKVCN